jgi:engulfment/cell motility protein 1
LHWGDFDDQEDPEPTIAGLKDKVDVSIISSVVSNVTTNDKSSVASDSTLKDLQQDKFTTTKITIHGYIPKSRGGHGRSHGRSGSKASSKAQQPEMVLLTFQPPNHALASEWLDGLLMLLNQQPITAETNKLITTMSDYGLRVRLLNVRFNDEDGMLGGMNGTDAPEVPSREGLDEDYYYQI